MKIVTLTNNVKILDLFLQGVEDKSQVIVGLDNVIPEKEYGCQLIDISALCDEFLSKFTTFKKCILINHLIEQGHRQFLHCDDDCAILKPVNLDNTRLKPAPRRYKNETFLGKIFDCKEHRYIAGNFVFNLSEKEAELYLSMFSDFVAKMREHPYLFFPQKNDNFNHIRDRYANKHYLDVPCLDNFFAEIEKIEDREFVTTFYDIGRISLQGFKEYLLETELNCSILHFNSGRDKIKYMELFYEVMSEKSAGQE